MPKLTRDNFSLAEMSECSFAERLGIDNTPDLKTLANLGIVVTRLEEVRALLGYPMHVNSGFRCEALERFLSKQDYLSWCSQRAVPQDDASWKKYFATKAHSRGLAADFTCSQFGSPRDVLHAIKSSSIRFDQCILEGSWIHISFASRMRGDILIKQFDAFGIATSVRYLPTDQMQAGVPDPMGALSANIGEAVGVR